MNHKKEDVQKMTNDILECLPGGFFVYRADEVKGIITFNKEVLKIYGCNTDEEFRALTGNSFKGMVHPDDLELVESNIALQIQKQNDLDYVEYRIICKDGTEKYVRDYGRFIHSREYGDIYSVFMHDVTQNKLMHSEKLNQYTSLIAALSSIYSALYYIDLEKNSFQEIFSDDSVHYVFGEKSDARNSLKQMVQTLVTDEYCAMMLRFTDLDTIRERMDGKNIIVQEYLEKTGGWTRCGFFSMERKKTGEVNKIICALRSISSEKEVLVSQENLIQALAIPYENIYIVDVNTGESICYRMGADIQERYGHKFAAGNYEQSIRIYIENDVLEEDRYLFDRISTISDVNDLLKEKKTYSFNYRVFRNRKVKYFQCQLAKPNLNLNEFVIAFKDVDEEKKQEFAQQRKVEEVLAVVEKFNVALQEETAISGALSKEYSSLFQIDAKTGKISLYRTDGTGMSPQLLEKILTYDDYETVLFKYIDAYVVPEERERIKELGRLNILLEQVPDNGLYKLGYRRNMNGVISYYEMNVAKTVNQMGEVTFILGLRDVDQEMRRQLKLTREMEMQREIIEGLGSEYYSVLFVNPITDVVTTYRAEDEEGRAIKEYFSRHNNCWSKGILSYSQEMISDASRSEFIEKLSLDYIKLNNRDYTFTYEKYTEDGTIYLQARVSYVSEKDGGLAVVIGTRNVDDLIKREKQQEKALQAALNDAETANKAKTDSLSKMSHDIRTPLNGIMGLLEMDERHSDDRKLIEENRGKIKIAANHLNSLLNDILQLSKLENGNVELSHEVIDLNVLATDVITMVAIEASERGITFNHGDCSVKLIAPFVYGSPLHLRQIFLNIFTNAIKYNKPGGSITCKVECKSIEEKMVTYSWTISDTGIGMGKEYVEHIFEPFSQERSDARSTYQGTGLGMAIVKSLIDKMGGCIEIESIEGEGSTFVVTIPFEIADVSDLKIAEKEVEEASIQNLRVLLVEDNELNMEIAQYLLEDAGAIVTKAFDGKQAVEIFENNPAGTFDVILMDVMMPNMNGIEATKTIRLIDRSDARMIPIIAMTANAFEEDRQATKEAGMNAHLSKPLDGKEVLWAISKFCHGRYERSHS